MKTASETLKLIIGLTVIFFLGYAFWWVTPFRTPKGYSNMEPTYGEDERIYFRRAVQSMDDVEPGDVALYMEYDKNLKKMRPNIGRVAGKAGQVLSVKNGHLEVDGKPQSGRLSQPGKLSGEFVGFRVPRNFIVVIYDNRDKDSRKLYQRLVHISRVYGKRLFKD